MPNSGKNVAARAAYEAYQEFFDLKSNWNGLTDVEVEAWEKAAFAAIAAGAVVVQPASDPPPGGGHTKP